jgi:hypothetical protein
MEEVPEESQLTNFVESDLKLLDETITSLLSASELLCNELDIALSSIPIHPYYRLVHEHLDGEISPITLANIEAPESFNIETVTNQISCLAVKYGDQFETQTQKLTSFSTIEEENVCNAFAVLSGEKFVVEQEKVANHLKFIGFLNSIPPEAIDADPVGVAQKMLSQYLKMY